MTPEQAERQRRSFAYGNVKIENDSITWEMISQGGGGIGREVSGRSASCPVGRVCDACICFLVFMARLKSCPSHEA